MASYSHTCSYDSCGAYFWGHDPSQKAQHMLDNGFRQSSTGRWFCRKHAEWLGLK